MGAHNGSAYVAGVIGAPISHSLSPAIHEYWLSRYQINGAYVPLSCTKDHVAALITALSHSTWRGLNVTMPFKTDALALADTQDDHAQACGAANMLSFDETGQIHAENSDGIGFAQLWHHAVAAPPPSCHIVMLGAGAAAQAVMVQLSLMGCAALTVLNRTLATAQDMAERHRHRLAITPLPLNAADDALQHADVVINCLGLDVLDTVRSRHLLEHTHKDCICIDISYGASGTPFTQTAQALGRHAIDGLLMLVWQARPGFAKWFGVEPEIDERLITMLRNQCT